MKLYNLTQSFRCGPSIVAAANALIARNREPLAQPMIADESTYSRDVEVMHGRTNDVILRLAQLLKEGYAPSDIAVLARSHRVLRRIAECASEIKLPVYRVGAGFDICETPQFRTFLAMLRLLINPMDRVAQLRLQRAGEPTDYYARYPHAAEELSTWSMKKLLAVGAGDDCWCGRAWAVPAADWWLEHCAEMTLPDALRWYSLRDAQDDLPPSGAITLATVHAVKGLEWPVVLVAELQEGTFPAGRALKETGGEKEERRLAYTAMTRAKERLILHWRSVADQSPDRGQTEPSRFLAEAGFPTRHEVKCV